MKRNFRKQGGITLIALVITIIVLLILAGVAISMLSGENGILNRAAEAKTETENAEQKEEVSLIIAEAEIQRAVNKDGEDGEVLEGDKETTFIKAMKNIEEDEENENKNYEGDITEAKNDENIIKLNKNVYIYDNMNISKFKNIVIDLNGNALVFMGGGITKQKYVYIYVIDTSADKTGKIMILGEPKGYTYLEKFDVNKDGVICTEDNDFMVRNDVYNHDSSCGYWELIKCADFDGDGRVNRVDHGIFFDAVTLFSHFKDVRGIWTLDSGIEIVTRCGCNK